MNRYEIMCSIPPGSIAPFKEVARLLLQFAEECEMEGMHAQSCPAIMLLGQQIAFFCHADVPAEGMQQKLFMRCLEQAEARRAQQTQAH